MGAIVKTVAASECDSGASYTDLGAEVLSHCLDKGLGEGKVLDLLIHAGIYPEGHMHEPASAALIQGRLSHSHREKLSATFSFDLHNGGGGSLVAMRVLNGFIESGKIHHGVVIAGDSRPQGCQAGALVIGKGAPGEGFRAFAQDSYTRYSGEYSSYSNYTGKELKTTIYEKDSYLDHCLNCAKQSVDAFLSGLGLDVEAINLMVPCQNPAGFVSGLADLYGGEKLIKLNSKDSCYSAGLILALARAFSKGVLKTREKLLFVQVGPGIIVDLALYENPRET